MRQGGREKEMRVRKISIDFDGPPKPRRRVLILAEVDSGRPGEHIPEVNVDIARTEAEHF